MEPVRIAIVGCGVIGKIHAQCCVKADNITLQAVCDVNKQQADKLGKEHAANKIYNDLDDVLNDDQVEGVILALPANLRAKLAVRVLKAGKHLLTEKPVARYEAQVQQLIDNRGDLTVAVCSSRYRSFAFLEKIRDFIAAGNLGQLRVVHIRGIIQDSGPRDSDPPIWRVSHKLNGGGIFVNWGCYDLDYMLGLLSWNIKPKTVLAQTWQCAPQLPMRVHETSDAETHALALIQCDEGMVIQIERAEFAAIKGETTWQIIGSKGSLRLQMTHFHDGPTEIFFDKINPDSKLTTQTLFSQNVDEGDAHDGPPVDFANAIRTGSTPRTSLENGLLMQKITDAVYLSAKEQRAVVIG
ncbi:MAG: Gfo/Idh/MocA family oxidoreductase [Phycisphaeraceae bacterium]|nr:Gfo/Idh/MocA family oxidoreductase [Phycisphaeraceae bacterium]